MRGKVSSGFGQARYFLSREGYCSQFLKQLGFVPFPGTLNVVLEEPFPTDGLQEIKIEGFTEEGKSFGECKCYRIVFKGMQAIAAALIFSGVWLVVKSKSKNDIDKHDHSLAYEKRHA